MAKSKRKASFGSYPNSHRKTVADPVDVIRVKKIHISESTRRSLTTHIDGIGGSIAEVKEHVNELLVKNHI